MIIHFNLIRLEHIKTIMVVKDRLKFLFILNPGSGNSTTDWQRIITNYFALLHYTIELYELPPNCSVLTIEKKIALFSPHMVIAVGGDGTVNLVAECLIQKNILLGILPAGSANGLAKELGISDDPAKALDVLITGRSKKIHVTMINNQLCVHLSDIGLNAYAMKKFKMQHSRGMWGYFIALLKVLWYKPMMEVEMRVNEKVIKINAAIIVIANGTQYATGALINPIGDLTDNLFEVISVKKLSFCEIFKIIIVRLKTAQNSL